MMTNPFDDEGFRARCSPGGSTYEELKALDEADDEWEVLPVVGEGAPRGQALFLTQQEWDDLCEIADHFRMVTEWVDRRLPEFAVPPDHEIQRQRRLAERIIEANQ